MEAKDIWNNQWINKVIKEKKNTWKQMKMIYDLKIYQIRSDQSLSCVWLFATPWTAAYQAPRSMGFSRQEYWNGVPFPSPL